MQYSEFVEVYGRLAGVSGRLEKTSILAEFLLKLKRKGESEWIYLLKGRVVADNDVREFGISEQLVIKAISKSFGFKGEDVVKKFRKLGDLGSVAEEFVGRKSQSTLFSRDLRVKKVFDNLQKVMEVEGKGAVDRKLSLISELLGHASGGEAKYVIRSILGDLRVGVADGVLRDAIAEAFFEEDKKEMAVKVEEAYDLAGDFAIVFEAAIKGKRALSKVTLVPGKPVKVMLPVKVEEIEEAFRICGAPVALEHKYDGFRVVISKNGGEIKLFTRRLEEVTKQFPDIIELVRENVKGDSFILDSEAVGYDSKTKKYRPFEAISQRIKRKYEIEKLIKELPVEINVFDVLYYNGKSTLSVNFKERRKIVEKIVSSKKLKIRPSHQIITSDPKKALDFYKNALKIGEEGIMFKKLDVPYHAGRRVGYIVKLKPQAKDLDLVIIGAEYGRGKRAGWLTSYILGCRNEKGEFLEVGKVSSGLKEKDEEGTSYDEMTKLLKPLIEETKGGEIKVKPKIVVSVTYQNVQGSPSYSSGWALRFPRITAYRPDRGIGDIATLKDIKKEAGKGR
tara:strand:- start:267 stop:1958 length:1692 start_codon:yes stop_codon:yes gene_type:complete